MDHSTIIDQLGGTYAVAHAVGCNPSNVSRWRKVGIPPERYPVIVKLARRHALAEVTLETLYAGRLALARRAARQARAVA
jgi:DNA-binding transcriptional regulator YdaS (Cro superfamily)